MDFSSRNETLQVDRATLDLSKLSNFRTVLREDEKREINQIIEKSSSIFTIPEDFRTKNSRSNRIIFITFKIFFLLFFIEKRNFSKISWKTFIDSDASRVFFCPVVAWNNFPNQTNLYLTLELITYPTRIHDDPSNTTHNCISDNKDNNFLPKFVDSRAHLTASKEKKRKKKKRKKK